MAATTKSAAEAAHNWKAGLGAEPASHYQSAGLVVVPPECFSLRLAFSWRLPLADSMDAQRVLVDHAFGHRSVVCGGP